ncbi:MAG: hypothetical protein FJ381_08820 [Verrucomicrobia bacterium]|nr:hypothetical protein [Verrucomicrobiota bacterium]
MSALACRSLGQGGAKVAAARRRLGKGGACGHPHAGARRILGMKLRFLLALLPALLPPAAVAAEEAFPPTPSGANEVKVLPPGILLRSAGPGEYFDRANDLFMPLFRYISRHDIAMTVPVEARVRDAAMYFWVAESQHAKVAGDEGAVVVERKPARRVASRGARGSYSRKNYERTRDELLAWVATQPGLAAEGEPYAVFWSGPFTPGFLKRYEVHVTLKPTGGG